MAETHKEKVPRKAILPKPEGYVARPPRHDKRSGGRETKAEIIATVITDMMIVSLEKIRKRINSF